MSLQTATVGPGGVEILVVIVLLKFLKEESKREKLSLYLCQTSVSSKQIPPADCVNSRIHEGVASREYSGGIVSKPRRRLRKPEGEF